MHKFQFWQFSALITTIFNVSAQNSVESLTDFVLGGQRNRN